MIKVKLFFLVACVSMLAPNLLNSYSQNKNAQPPAADFQHFPLVDYRAPEPSDPAERAKRANKGKKHNIKHTRPIDESIDSMYLQIDWDINLAALPVDQSDAIVVGRVTKAEAYLSENRTGIYSEFTIHLEAILKHHADDSLKSDTSLTVYRTGGRLRFPSGKILVSSVSHQDLPRVGNRYVFFLRRKLGSSETEDLGILTGYHLQNGKVFPLDKVLPPHPMNQYKGASENRLFTDLASSLR